MGRVDPVRGFLAVWALGLAAILTCGPCAAADPPSAVASPAAPAFDVQMLPAGSPAPTIQAITSGTLDSFFEPFRLKEARKAGTPFWLRLQARIGFTVPAGTNAALIVRKGRHFDVEVWPASDATSAEAEGAAPTALAVAATRPTFRGAHEAIFVLPASLAPGAVLYARVAANGVGSEELAFSTGALRAVLERGAYHSWMITFAFGALMAMAITSLLVWFILSDRLLVYYGVLFSMEALYVAFFSGQGFDWPLLSWATPLLSHAWNVPVAIGGAAACLFVREIADLKRFLAPRVHDLRRLRDRIPRARGIECAEALRARRARRERWQSDVRRRPGFHAGRRVHGVAAWWSRGGLLPHCVGAARGVHDRCGAAPAHERCERRGLPAAHGAAAVHGAGGGADRTRRGRSLARTAARAE